MFKKNILGGVFFSAFVFASSAYAGKVELTTFYPSPYGEFTNLQSTSDSYFATTSGAVGIGTTDPSTYRLLVSGTTDTNILGITDGTAMAGVFIDTVGPTPVQFGSRTNHDVGLYTNDAAPGFVIQASTDYVGIGTTSPSYRLDVLGNQAATYIARIKNSNAAAGAKGLIIDMGVANASRTTATRFIDFAGAGVVAGKIQGGASAVAFTTTLADFAEYFRANPKNMPQPGELVEFDPSGAQSVQRSWGDGSRVLVGVVSSNPAFIGNGPICKVGDDDCDANHAKYNALVALVGQVSVKVNTSRGPIAIADPIAASDTPGEGAKAVSVGHIVGYAQEALASGSGTIKVLIRPQYYYSPHLKA